MNEKYNEYKKKANDYMKEKGYDEKAKEYYDKTNNYIKENEFDKKAKGYYNKANNFAEEKGIKKFFKNLFKNFKKGETKAVLFIAAVSMLLISAFAYSNLAVTVTETHEYVIEEEDWRGTITDREPYGEISDEQAQGISDRLDARYSKAFGVDEEELNDESELESDDMEFEQEITSVVTNRDLVQMKRLLGQ